MGRRENCRREWRGRAEREAALKGQCGGLGRRAYQESGTKRGAEGKSGTESCTVSPPASARPAETVVDEEERGVGVSEYLSKVGVS